MGEVTGMSIIASTHALKMPLAAFLLASAAWAQGGAITTGGNSSRPINVRGVVALAEGGSLQEKAAIEMVCMSGQAQQQGKTDSKGAFNVYLGANSFEGTSDAGSVTSSVNRGLSVPEAVQLDGASVMSLAGCFIRAVLRGYTSDTFDLGRIRAGDVSTNVGTLLLRPTGKSSGAVVSATSLAVPKGAQQSFDKARDLIAKRQFADAEKELNRAV